MIWKEILEITVSSLAILSSVSIVWYYCGHRKRVKQITSDRGPNDSQDTDYAEYEFSLEKLIRFTFSAYPLTLTPAQFVDGLNTQAATSGIKPLSSSQRDQLVSDLTMGTKSRYQVLRAVAENQPTSVMWRPPFNAEFVLYLLLRKEEREVIIGDLIEEYSQILERFNKRRADIWFYKQVGGSLFPLLRRALLRIGALVWLGRILRRLIS